MMKLSTLLFILALAGAVLHSFAPVYLEAISIVLAIIGLSVSIHED